MPVGHTRIFTPFLSLVLASGLASAEQEVTVSNFVRAETDQYMARFHAQAGIGKMAHVRSPVNVQQQDVIRMNRDTIYSTALLDLTHPAEITLPDSDGRFQSMQVVSQDHYTIAVEHDPGTYLLTQDTVGTRYVAILIRTFADPGDPEDMKAAHALQDGITISQANPGSFEVPDWDNDSLAMVRGLLLSLGATDPDAFAASFGTRDEVDPIQHLLGTAAGWGGNPPNAATYHGGFPEQNDGKVPHSLTVKNVPVDGFWSITVYNEDGFMERNDRDVYSYNGVTAERGKDGSATINFGDCHLEDRVNCIPITDGWNYVVRLYQPRAEALDGSWTFPKPQADR